MSARLQTLRQALGGDLFGNRLLCPTIGHSARDRGTSYTEAPGAPGGLLAKVYNGSGQADDLAAKDRALAILGEAPTFSRQRENPPDPAEIQRREDARRQAEARALAESGRRQRRARAMWAEAGDPRGTLVTRYLRSRGLVLPEDIATRALRFHPRCPWGEERVPAIVAAMRDMVTGELRAIHRTGLTPEGRKIDRKMFGPAMGAAVMLDRLDPENGHLVVGEGIETVLTARQHLRLRPAWALGSSGAIAALPVLEGVHTLVVLAENDANGASERAAETVGDRWHAAGRSVEIIWPPTGAKDLNDTVREDAAVCR